MTNHTPIPIFCLARHGDDVDCWRDRATMMLVVGRVAEETTMTINVIGNYSNKGINNSGCSVSDDDNDANDSSSCKVGDDKDYRKGSDSINNDR